MQKSLTYNPIAIEEKWRERWEKDKLYQPDLDKAKKPFYNLMMFPYPSAEGLHVGSVFTFTGVDTYGRFKRMQGYDVFQPIGLDGFGIHSENYALQVGRHPKEQAKISEKNFYRQLHSIGNGFDWSRKLETYDPLYYKWTQWIFVEFFKRGLAYRKKSPVNFCPSCKTVLADEQVVTKSKIKNQKSKMISVNPRRNQRESASERIIEEVALKICERCETEVELKELEQWFFKITKYADRLLANIPKLNWTEKIKIAQEQWIGKKEGTLIKFQISNFKFQIKDIEVFTTRADTLYGATFIVLAPEQPIVSVILNSFQNLGIPKQVRDDIERYVVAAKKKTEQDRIAEGKEKTGVFSGLYTINPLNQQELPVWIADYAIMSYGTGALFGDAHDERDVVFAKKYGIPLKPTIKTGNKERDARIMNLEECYTGYGILFDSGEFSGLTSKEAIKRVTEWLAKKGKGGKKVTYHLRDWLISRQRYWGPPIPMVYCQTCADAGRSWFTVQNTQNTQKSRKSDSSDSQKVRYTDSSESSEFSEMKGWFPVPEDQLPVVLPDVKDWKPKGGGKSPLASVESFVNTKCPHCKSKAVRETDVSDTFLDSAWYFFRYLATERDDLPFPSKAFINSKSEARNSKQIQNANDQNSKQFRNSNFDIRAFARRARWLPVTMYIGGAEHSVLHLLYSRFITMVFKDMGLIDFEEPYARFYAHGLIIKEGAKMSKSRGNVVNPDEYLAKYGADTLRAYLRFVGPFDMGGDFRDSGIEGMHRFLKRVWNLFARGPVAGFPSTPVKQANSDFVLRSTSASAARPSKLEERRGVGSPSTRTTPRFPQPSLVAIRMMHKTIKGVTEDLENLRFNIAIAKLMEFVNHLNRQPEVNRKELEVLLLLLAPFTPFLAEELYQQIQRKGERGKGKLNPKPLARQGAISAYTLNPWSVHLQPWPKYDPKLLKEDEVTIVVQVNGKVRDQLKIKSPASPAGREKLKMKNDIEKLSRESDKVKKYLEGRIVKKVIYVPGKIINFVVAD